MLALAGKRKERNLYLGEIKMKEIHQLTQVHAIIALNNEMDAKGAAIKKRAH